MILKYGCFCVQENEYFQRIGVLQSSTSGWNGTPGVTTSPVVKKVIRLDVPIDKYPNVCEFYLALTLVYED